MEEMERSYSRQVVQRTGGRISDESGAARILRMNPNTLRSRMSKLGIERVEEVKYANLGAEKRRAIGAGGSTG